MGHRIIMAGGGTGGHIFPALAIAHALMKARPDTEILFIGAQGRMEMEKVPQAGFRIEGLDIAGFNRSSLIKNIGLPFKLLKSFLQVRRIFKSFKPDAAIGVGGYSSFPVLRYAQQQGVKTFLHESNSFAGKSNIMLGRKATRIFVAKPGMEKFFPADRIQVTGNPVRRTIEDGVTTREDAIRFFHLDPAKTTVLSVGGSLGAKSINEALRKDLAMFGNAGMQLIWQTGKPFEAEGKHAAEGKANVWCGPFITQMEQAYAAADIVISRAGAMAIAELCITGKPAVLVPFPHAAEDHQTHNARQLADKGAGIMVTDAEAAGKLVAQVIDLSRNEERRRTLSENIRKLAIGRADEVIAGSILAELEKEKV